MVDAQGEPAHGTGEERADLEARRFAKEDYDIVLIGHEGHEEVVGTTGQAWLSRSGALQGTALAGLGYGAAGTIHGVGDRDYHYGLTPQAILAFRLVFGEAASLDVTGRGYYVSGVASTESRGSENVARADASFTVRLVGRHAIALKYVWSHRDAHYPDLGDRTQTRATIGLFYTLLGNSQFGAVDWRGAEESGR